MNYQNAWVSCNGQERQVMSNGYPDYRSSNQGQYEMGHSDYYFDKGKSAWTCGCSARLQSNSSYASGSRSATGSSVTIGTKPAYTVSYNANGGSGQPGNQTKWYNETLTLSGTKPTRTHYTFAGWNTNNAGTGTNYSPGQGYTGNANLGLYAKWNRIYHTISYNANGGTGAPAAQSKASGASINLSGTKPTRTGYTFLGWATSASGNVAYQPGAAFSTNANTTLYAKWQIITYTISYNANGGTGAPGAQKKNYGTNITLSGTKPTRTHYTFVRWNTSTANNGTAYAPGGTYSANANATLYAIWQIIQFKITYNANGGTGAPGQQTKNSGTNIALSTTKPTRTDYNFLGWATSANGSVAYAPGATYTGNANITLYAVWQLAYKKPRITNLFAFRCDSAGTANEGGTYIRVKGNWATDKDLVATYGVTVEHRLQTATSYTKTSVLGGGTAHSRYDR